MSKMPGMKASASWKSGFVSHHTSGGDLNENGPHRLIGSGTNSRCDLVGLGVALLEEVCH